MAHKPKGRWTLAQRAQNNEFVENELENWVLMNQKNTRVDSNDKRMKIDSVWHCDTQTHLGLGF